MVTSEIEQRALCHVRYCEVGVEAEGHVQGLDTLVDNISFELKKATFIDTRHHINHG
jgi:hypothetical protein